jgi:hypothetical protein
MIHYYVSPLERGQRTYEVRRLSLINRTVIFYSHSVYQGDLASLLAIHEKEGAFKDPGIAERKSFAVQHRAVAENELRIPSAQHA